MSIFRCKYYVIYDIDTIHNYGFDDNVCVAYINDTCEVVYFNTKEEMDEWLYKYNEDYLWFISYNGKLAGFERELKESIEFFSKCPMLKIRLENIYHKNFGNKY